MITFDDAVARLSAPPYGYSEHLIVVRGGETVFEHSFAGRPFDEPVHLFSVTKSVLSTVVMLAVRDGELSLEDTIGELLGEHVPEARRDTTIRHLLTMTGGSEPAMFYPSDDDESWLPAFLAAPQVAAPGTVFAYDDRGAHVLACAVQTTIGDIEAYAADRIFTPLGIDRWKWRHDPDGVAAGGSELWLSPLDMVKLGEAWRTDTLGLGRLLAEATSEQSKPGWHPGRAYGHLFWTEEIAGHKAFLAAGWAGQHVFVIPGAALTIVSTGDADRWSEGREDDMDVIRELARSIVT